MPYPNASYPTNLAAAEDTGLAGTPDSGAFMVVVNHGTDADVARPEGAAAVYWIGSVQPNNATLYDIWSEMS